MPEQFALQQVFAQRVAVDRNERFVLAQTVVVDRAGDQFLASAAFAGDQDGRTGWRALRDKPVNGLHLRAQTDDVLESVFRANLGLEVEILLQQAPALQRTLYHQFQFVRLERLRDVVEGTELHRLDRRVDLREPGDHDDIHVGMRLLYPAQHFEAVHIWHHDVEDHHVVAIFLDFLQGLPPVLHGLDLEFLAAEDAQATSEDDLFVVHDQNSRAHETASLILLSDSADGGVSGKKMRNADPSPTLLSTSIKPQIGR